MKKEGIYDDKTIHGQRYTRWCGVLHLRDNAWCLARNKWYDQPLFIKRDELVDAILKTEAGLKDSLKHADNGGLEVAA